MKTLIIALLSVLLINGVSLAQDRDRTQDRDKDKIQQRDRLHTEDYLYLKKGKLFQVTNGVQSTLQQKVTLQNGTVVNPDGTYQLQTREQYRLRDGECLDMNGNRYLNRNRFNQRKMMTHREIERIRTLPVNKPKMNKAMKQGGKKGN